ncbi:MAG: NADH-quinone oxidoreductase subunit J [Deltaproteobacteria bacterium]|nr:NADH-quinone oxidoreductase subunit J [Deltaproteobacteria bacterium]
MQGLADAGWLAGLRLSDLLFYAVALVAVTGALAVAFGRNIVYSAFGLLLALFGVAAIYVFISADLVAVVQLLVYIGGVLVLILFAIMLTSKIGDARRSNLTLALVPGGVIFLLLLGLTVFLSLTTPWGTVAGRGLPTLRDAALEPTSERIGDALLTDFLLPFEIASVVLLAALIGAVIIARKEMRLLTTGGGQGNRP